MRCSRALVVLLAVATVAPFAGAAAAADPEPPGAVLVSPDAGSYSALSVSPGRVVWEGSGTVQKRAVTSDASTVTLGAQTTIGHGLLSPYQYPTGLSSGARTLWASSNGHPYGYQVNLTSGTSTKVLSHAAVPVRLSGNRALYQRQTDAHYVLYDMHTGKSTDVTEKYNTRTSSYSFTVDLFGNYLVYTTKSFAIMRKNLSDGSAPLTIVPPDHNGNNGSVVIIYGDWVAWDRYFHPGDGFDAFDHCGLKNLRTMAPATHNCVTDLTSAGSIKRTWITRAPSPGACGRTARRPTPPCRCRRRPTTWGSTAT